MYNAKKEFLAAYPKALIAGNAAVFAGAGLSQGAGYVNWRELLRDIASDIGLDVDQEHDLISLAQYHVNERGGRGVLNQHLIDLFTKSARVTENHQILSRLPIQTYWTTNYDRLIESTLEVAHRRADVKATKESLAITLPDADAVVYKMHGDIGAPDKAVLTKDDYENYNEDRQLFSLKLQGDLVSKTFVFIGFSFDDPNLDYILTRIRLLLGRNQRPHYCFFRNPQRSDFKRVGLGDAEVDTAFAYAKVKHEHRVKDLRRFAINTVLVDDYSDITELLRLVERRYSRHTVLMSGSAAAYGRRSPDEGQRLIQAMSRRLASQFAIVSGFGIGVGSAVINGVLQHLDAADDHHLDGHLVLRPFPQWSSGPSTLADLQLKYREQMAALAGIAVFLYGNKQDGSTTHSADGVRQEFDIAVKRGLKVVPVGATGYVARELWEKVVGDFSAYYADMPHLKDRFDALGKEDLSDDDIVERVYDLVVAIRDA